MEESSTSEHDSPAFTKALVTLRGLLARAVRDDARTRYQVGSLLCRVKNRREEYGEHAVERLAQKLAIAAATLYRYATVAESWSPEEIAIAVDQANARGEPLSWSHLVALARVETPELRAELLERCLAESWHVRELVRNVAEALGEAAKDRASASAEPGTMGEVLEQNVARASLVSQELTTLLETLGERASELATNRDLLGRALTTCEELGRKVETALGWLRQVSSPPNVEPATPSTRALGGPRRSRRVRHGSRIARLPLPSSRGHETHPTTVEVLDGGILSDGTPTTSS
jgi:hypothetical protein